MKFSNRKKAKMRKYNQRRINKECKYMIGCTVDFKRHYTVTDQTKINGTVYLLAKSPNGKYAIYKIVKVGEYVQLSQKKILENLEKFSNHQYWDDHSTIQITTEGEIKAVKRTVKKWECKDGELVFTYIVID